MNRHILQGSPTCTDRKHVWTYPCIGVLCSLSVILVGCSSTSRRVTPSLETPPRLSAEEMARQGETVEKPLAPDPIRFGLPPATIAVLTNEVASDMGWKEHFILQEEREGSYTVILREGSALSTQRRVSITPTPLGSEVLILPPDEGLAERIKERTLLYLTNSGEEEQLVSPRSQRFSRPFAQVWRATKQTIIDGGFSFKTADEDVGFIETERVARPPAVSYDYTSVEWRYRIRMTSIGTNKTEITVEAVVEATPNASTLEQLTSGAMSLFSVPFGSWISSAATGSSTSRLILPSRGELEKEFCVALAKKIPSAKRKEKRPAKKRSRAS